MVTVTGTPFTMPYATVPLPSAGDSPTKQHKKYYNHKARRSIHIKLINTLPLLTHYYNTKPLQTHDLHKFHRLVNFLSFQDQNTLNTL